MPWSARNQTLTAAFAYDGERGVLTESPLDGRAADGRSATTRAPPSSTKHR